MHSTCHGAWSISGVSSPIADRRCINVIAWRASNDLSTSVQQIAPSLIAFRREPTTSRLGRSAPLTSSSNSSHRLTVRLWKIFSPLPHPPLSRVSGNSITQQTRANPKKVAVNREAVTARCQQPTMPDEQPHFKEVRPNIPFWWTISYHHSLLRHMRQH